MTGIYQKWRDDLPKDVDLAFICFRTPDLDYKYRRFVCKDCFKKDGDWEVYQHAKIDSVRYYNSNGREINKNHEFLDWTYKVCDICEEPINTEIDTRCVPVINLNINGRRYQISVGTTVRELYSDYARGLDSDDEESDGFSLHIKDDHQPLSVDETYLSTLRITNGTKLVTKTNGEPALRCNTFTTKP